jgi:hypothetical protein
MAGFGRTAYGARVRFDARRGDVFVSASMTTEPRAELVAFVSEYYGRLLPASGGLATNACCVGGAPPEFIATRLANVHPDVSDRFYGCGFPIPHATEGATVLDLGCGTGDYGQTAEYRGGIEGAEAVFWLDDHHAFERGRPERVCANTAAMLAKTRYARWFDIRGGTDLHFGAFPCGPTMAATQYAVASADGTNVCC